MLLYIVSVYGVKWKLGFQGSGSKINSKLYFVQGIKTSSDNIKYETLF